MGILDLLSGKGIQDAALGQLKKFMQANDITLAALRPRDTPNSDGDTFDLLHFKEPVTIITNTDLAKYQSAVNKCIEHGHEF